MENENNQFGMTEEELKNYKRSTILLRVKNFFLTLEPALIKIFSNIIYYLVRFFKALISTMFRMILGKEI